MCFLAENQEGLYRVEVGALGSHANCILDKWLVSSHNQLYGIIDCNVWGTIIDCKSKRQDNRLKGRIDYKCKGQYNRLRGIIDCEIKGQNNRL